MRSLRDSRDDKLWSLLPPKDSPYSYCSLSKVETDALVEALADGFGDALIPGSKPFALPDDLREKSGLLDHFFYSQSELGYELGEWDDAFWDCGADDDDSPAPYEWFPLKFCHRRLRVYFQNQFERFCLQERRKQEQFWEQKILEDPTWPPLKHSKDMRWIFERRAGQMLYQKPWYEYQALQFMRHMEMSLVGLSKHPLQLGIHISGLSGQLGRLVEQYYWRFRFEGVAITGSGARKGASAGGRAKAALHRAQRRAWQRVASETWAHRPELSKTAVAKIVRNRLSPKPTAKHIARYITHP
jgi:hypothetical protein